MRRFVGRVGQLRFESRCRDQLLILSVQIICWHQLLRWSAESSCWDYLLRLPVVVRCWDYQLWSIVAIIGWEQLWRWSVELLRAAVAIWDYLLRFLLWWAVPVASQDDLLGSADRGSVVVSCCEDLLWSAVEIICWEQLFRVLVESSWRDYLLRWCLVVSWDYLLLFSVVISCCDYQSSNLVIRCWDYQLRRSVVISCVVYLLRSVYILTSTIRFA